MLREVRIIFAASMALYLIARSAIAAECVDVKYHGAVCLATFDCSVIERSSFIRGVCYDRRQNYMLINLNGVWYHYCEIDRATVSSLMEAESMGRFYNRSIKGRFDCRVNRLPKY
jgi:hypothetical protein